MKTIIPHNNTVMSELSLHPSASHVQTFLIALIFLSLHPFHGRKYLFSKSSRNQCALDGKAFLNISYLG